MSYTVEQFRSQRGCLSYVIGDQGTKHCLIIDPDVEAGDAYEEYVRTNGLVVHYIVETHTHADHLSAAPALRTKTNALLLRHERAPSRRTDRALRDGDTVPLGDVAVTVLDTPGHTDDSITLRLGPLLFTGDTLLIGSTGRTDFQNGSSEALYRSLWEKIIPLGDDLTVYPAHDYRGRASTTIGEERRTNPRLQLPRPEFIAAMDAYRPPAPELFDVAVVENSH